MRNICKFIVYADSLYRHHQVRTARTFVDGGKQIFPVQTAHQKAVPAEVAGSFKTVT